MDSESPLLADLVARMVLSYATRPPFAGPVGAFAGEAVPLHVLEAYRRLAMSPDFLVVLEDWVKTILLNPAGDDGERRFVQRLVIGLHQMQQR